MYNVNEPVDTIFSTVKDLCEIAELAGCLYLLRQHVNIVYLIISKQPIFRNNVQEWMRKPVVNKTWTNFMTHFRQAHQELRDTDTTIDELGYQSANVIVEQIVYRLRAVEKDEDPGSLPHVPPTPPPPPLEAIFHPQSQANAIISHSEHAALVQIMMQNM